jgi:hypothetical protein
MDRVDEILKAFELGFGTEKLLAELLAISKSGDYWIDKIFLLYTSKRLQNWLRVLGVWIKQNTS